MSEIRKVEYALPSQFYGDPAERLDEIRSMEKAAQRKAEVLRRNKARRIRSLVKQQMKGERRNGI